MSQPPENYKEYRMRGDCPRCGTTITLGSDNMRLMMLICEGCGHGLAYHKGRIYSVRAQFLEALNMAFKTRDCGRVDTFDMSSRYLTAPGIPTDARLQEALWAGPEDCLETLKRLDKLPKG